MLLLDGARHPPLCLSQLTPQECAHVVTAVHLALVTARSVVPVHPNATSHVSSRRICRSLCAADVRFELIFNGILLVLVPIEEARLIAQEIRLNVPGYPELRKHAIHAKILDKS